MYEGLSDKVGEEDVHGRLGRVVKVARWAAHNMLLQCGAKLSALFVDWRLIGTHAKVMGDKFFLVRRGTYIALDSCSAGVSGNALLGSKEFSVESWFSLRTGSKDVSVESRFSAGTGASVESRFSLGFSEQAAASGDTKFCIVMYAQGEVGDPDNLDPQWVVPSCAEDDQHVKVRSMKDTGATYNDIIALVWDLHMEVLDKEHMIDEDTNERVLVYNVVILGRRQVFDGAEWDILYHHLSRWASTTHDNVVWYDNV